MSPPENPMPPLENAVEEALRASIEADGVIAPIVVDQHGRILDGHQRRIAKTLNVDYETRVVEVRDDERARELAVKLSTGRRHLDAEQRWLLASRLREQGYSDGVIAAALGSSRRMIGRDLASTGAARAPPDRTPGRDGKTYRRRSRESNDVFTKEEHHDTQLESLLTTHVWGDTEGALRAVDDCVARLAEVLTPELFSLKREWPAWLDGPEGDEFCIDPRNLVDGDRALLAAALVHDLMLNWHGGPDSASWPLRRILEVL